MKFINKELWLFVVATHGDVYSNATIHVPPLLKSLLCVVLGYEQVRLPFTSPCSSLFGCKQCFAKLVRIQNNIDLCVSGHIGQLSRARVAYLLPPLLFKLSTSSQLLTLADISMPRVRQ